VAFRVANQFGRGLVSCHVAAMMEARMLNIDGSQGEGGGQIVRSSLALALVTGNPITLTHIRARRKKPGLMRQHLTAVQAARRIAGAEVQGAQIGSSRLVFVPGKVQTGAYEFDIGSAGSTTLVLQTVLPALMLGDAVSTITLTGGTHNPLAPPYDFVAQAFLPLLARMGPQVEMVLERHGFYPAGGGRLAVTIRPCPTLASLTLLERGEIRRRRVRALVANLPRHIAERECQTIAARSGWDASSWTVEELRGTLGPGNAAMIELAYDSVTEVFTAFGEKGVRAEQIGARVWEAAARYLEAGVPVGEHLADQLLLPLGIGAHQGTGGGEFRTLEPSPHSTTHIAVLRQFLDVDVATEQHGPDDWIVRVGRERG
jgi:RNA 3'-terminal phosphate cyclase (ATP)